MEKNKNKNKKKQKKKRKKITKECLRASFLSRMSDSLIQWNLYKAGTL